MPISPTLNRKLACFLFSCLICTSCLADNAEISVYLSGNAPHYHLVYQHLRQRLLELTPGARIQLIPETAASDNRMASKEGTVAGTRTGLRVTIGTDAFENALKTDPSSPILALFLPRRTFETLTAQYRPVKASTIFLDQSLKRQIRFIELLLPQTKTISVAIGSISRSQLPELRELAQKKHFRLRVAELTLQTNPIHALAPIIKDSDVFMALPEQASMNRIIAKWALQLGYRQQVPIVGFSKAYTDAGALAAIYSTPENTGDYAAELLSAWLNDKDDAVWHPHYNRYFTITINPAVARSLRLSLPEIQQLYRLLDQPGGMEQ